MQMLHKMRNICLLIELYQRTSPRRKQWAVRKHFFTRCKIFDWLRNIIASILRENVLVYLSLNIICSSKLISFLVINLFRSFIFERFWWRTLISMKNIYKSKTTNWKKINFSFSLYRFIFPFPIPHSPFLLLVTFWLFRKTIKKIAWCTSALLLLVVQYSDESEGRVSKQTTIKNIQRCYTLKRLISYVLIQP